MRSSKNQLKCANPDKSTKAKNRMENIVQEEMDKLDFNKINYKPPPNEKIVS